MLYNSPKEPHNEGFRNGKREKVAQEEVDEVISEKFPRFM
jgi:hypothetical protein